MLQARWVFASGAVCVRMSFSDALLSISSWNCLCSIMIMFLKEFEHTVGYSRHLKKQNIPLKMLYRRCQGILTAFYNHYLEQRVGGCLVFDSSHISAGWVNVKQEALIPCKIYSIANSCAFIFFHPVRVHFALLQASNLRIYLSRLGYSPWRKVRVLKWPEPVFFTCYFIFPWVVLLPVKLFSNVCFNYYHSVLTENNLCTHISLKTKPNQTKPDNNEISAQGALQSKSVFVFPFFLINGHLL